MPIINVKLMEGVFSQQEKAEIIEKVTDAVVSVAGEILQERTIVLIDEVQSGDYGVGGAAVRSEDFLALRGQDALSA